VWEINLLSLQLLIFWNYNSNITALMKDQVDSLKANGIEACFINSSQTSAEQQVHIENLKNNKVKMVYVAPESLSYLKCIQPNHNYNCSIDEAHCISDMTLDLPISI
jgi:ATP-dependent DNA helicase RecQ